MAIPLSSKPNTVAPNSAFPYGDIKDNGGANDGTPINRAVYGDFHQFFARLIALSGITPNGLPENATNGFQYYEALTKLINPEPWRIVGAAGEPVFEGGWSATPGSPVKFKKTGLGRVEIFGRIQGTPTSNEAFTLPVGYRPLSDITVLGWLSEGVVGVGEPARIGIFTGGEVLITKMNLNDPVVASVVDLNFSFPIV